MMHDTEAQLLSRTNERLDILFPAILSAAGALLPGTMLDGEVLALVDGCPSHNALLNHRPETPVCYCAFDILALRGHDTMGLPLARRRALLEEVLADAPNQIRLSAVFDRDTAVLIRVAPPVSLQGIVAKRRSSVYEAGCCSGAWVRYPILPHVATYNR